MEQFGKELQKRRERRGISRRTLGELCGISEKTVARYERGEREPKARDAAVIASFFGTSVEEMLGL